MKTSSNHGKRGESGFATYILVLSTGTVLLFLTLMAYKRAVNVRETQSSVQLRADYAEKEDSILRAIISIVPNRAIQAMKHNSNLSTTASAPLKWDAIFQDSFTLANARTSISDEVMANVSFSGLTGSKEIDVLPGTETQSTSVVRKGNSGDSSSTLDAVKMGKIFKPFEAQPGTVLPPLKSGTAPLVRSGINRSFGTGFPPPLETANSTTVNADETFPIISDDKQYGPLATGAVGLPVAQYKKFNLIKYPNISFGYAKPGEWFVAKRNWWAFSLDAAAQEFEMYDPTNPNASTVPKLGRNRRDFVISIYEIPSQLAISASSFMALGQFESGEAWLEDQVKISGGVFAGKAQVEESGVPLSAVASRRGMEISDNAVIGDPDQPLDAKYTAKPFEAGAKEAYYKENQGAFLPLSLASESGQVAFIPINRGAEFFDRFHTNVRSTESNTVSPTTWNKYSVGALQCAMQLDITERVSATNPTPTKFRFSYLKNGARQNLNISLTSSGITGLPPGYLLACAENQTYNFGTSVVDVAYGKNGTYAYQTGVTGSVTFNNARFGDPLVGVLKSGYYKPSYPFEVKLLPSGKVCVAVYPQRFAKFLASINADDTSANHSLVVNVDYTNIGATYPLKPSIPCTDLDYGLILQECSDFTSFPKGFSLVTNLRTYIGDDFNVVEGTAPTGYTPPTGEKYYPPCSLFAPEKRYGVEVDPFAVNLAGQVGSLASETAADPIRPLDSKNMSGTAIGADRIRVNLKPIRHPAELPPVTMMNWLVVLEERRREFVNY